MIGQRPLFFGVCVCFVTVLCLRTSTWAVDPSTHISQYAHTAWRIQDGIFGGAPNAIVQTNDGYLWIGTHNGLVRFDGVRFSSWTPPNGKLSSNAIFSLLAGKDGGVWIGTADDLALLKDGNLTNYSDMMGRVNAIFADHNGTVWVTRSRIRDHNGPLCEVADTKLRCKGAAEGITQPYGGPLVEDLEGNLWMGCADILLRWREGSSATFAPPGLKDAKGLSGIQALAVTRDGSIWSGINRRGRGLGLQYMVRGTWRPFRSPELDGEQIEVTALFVDTENALWVGTVSQGIYRIHDERVEHFDSRNGLSGDSVTTLFEDREHNLWVATTDGIDSFHDIPVLTFSAREGLGSNLAYSVLAARDGTIWIGNHGSLDYLNRGKLSSISLSGSSLGERVTSMLEDHRGRLWIGIDDNLYIFEKGKFEKVLGSANGPIGTVVAITEDRDDDVWAEVLGKVRKLVHIRDRKVHEELSAPGMPAATSLAADPNGGIWLGLGRGGFARYRPDHLEKFSLTAAENAQVLQIIARPDGSVLGASTAGFVYFQDGTVRVMTTQNGLACNNVYSLVTDTQENLWLYSECGLFRVANTELQKWLHDNSAKVKVDAFDIFDGARPWGTPFEPQASRSSDGRLWFANENVVQMINPEHLIKNPVSPPVHIEEIVADHKIYSPSKQVVLPPLTRDIEIDYTALSYVVPQKVHFRYRLEGKEQNWQEAGGRRQAFYNDLRPGRYSFRVVASNNDGIWNEEGATLDFGVAPAWFQTTWFRITCVAIAIIIVWSIYRLRVRQIGRAMSARFDERLAERTRMARELHDTFLQTVQGSKLVADDALENVNDPIRTRRALEQLSQWLAQATQEGRAALHSLRTSTTETNDLAAAFRRALEDCRRETSIRTDFSVVGDSRQMHPVVRDEVYRIGYEAIRNACTHSAGSRVDVLLSYTDDLSVRVRDNGIGIDPAVAESGRNGHFGLQGMRERAARIGARLTIDGSANSGTEINVVVPGRIVFRKPPAARFEKIKTILNRMNNN